MLFQKRIGEIAGKSYPVGFDIIEGIPINFDYKGKIAKQLKELDAELKPEMQKLDWYHDPKGVQEIAKRVYETTEILIGATDIVSKFAKVIQYNQWNKYITTIRSGFARPARKNIGGRTIANALKDAQISPPTQMRWEITYAVEVPKLKAPENEGGIRPSDIAKWLAFAWAFHRAELMETILLASYPNGGTYVVDGTAGVTDSVLKEAIENTKRPKGIYGTEKAINQIVFDGNNTIVTDEMRNELHRLGKVGSYRGKPIVELDNLETPLVDVDGTWTDVQALSDKSLWVPSGFELWFLWGHWTNAPENREEVRVSDNLFYIYSEWIYNGKIIVPQYARRIQLS